MNRGEKGVQVKVQLSCWILPVDDVLGAENNEILDLYV